MINKTELHNIFQKLREGDNSQFELLYKNYNQLVYKISFSILKNKESSEDVTQNIFAKIYSLKKDKLPTSKEATWLYTITKNEAISYYRKEKTNVTLEEIYEVKEAECKELQNIIDKEKYEKLISGLSVKEKEVISLKIIGELSFKEIAKILNEPIGTVQWRYYKALNSLQLLLGNISMLFAGISTIFIVLFSNVLPACMLLTSFSIWLFTLSSCIVFSILFNLDFCDVCELVFSSVFTLESSNV